MYFGDKHSETHTHALALTVDPPTLWQWQWHASSWRAPPPPPPSGSCASSPWDCKDHDGCLFWYMNIFTTTFVIVKKINSMPPFNSPKGSSGSHHHHHHKTRRVADQWKFLLAWLATAIVQIGQIARSRPPANSFSATHLSYVKTHLTIIRSFKCSWFGFLAFFWLKMIKIWVLWPSFSSEVRGAPPSPLTYATRRPPSDAYHGSPLLCLREHLRLVLSTVINQKMWNTTQLKKNPPKMTKLPQ